MDIGLTLAAAKSTGVNVATRPAPIRAALTTMQDRVLLALAALQPAVELLDAIPAAPAVMADLVTATATAWFTKAAWTAKLLWILQLPLRQLQRPDVLR